MVYCEAQQWPVYLPAVALMAPLPRMSLRHSEEVMAIDQVDQKVVTQTPTAEGGQQTIQTDSRQVTRSGPAAPR